MSDGKRELYSLLIPLRGERLLVPRMCVAEVIAFVDPQRDTENVELPEWFVGLVDWNGRRLPVLSFDRRHEGEAGRSRRGRTRVVVFHALSSAVKGDHYGLLTQGFPQLVRVNPDVLSLENEQPLPEDQPALCRVRMIHEYPLIPDLERIERMLSALALH